MAGWEVEWFDEDTEELVPLAIAKFGKVYDELNNFSTAEFTIPNTSANRAIVAQDRSVIVYFDSDVQFVGVLSAVEYSNDVIKCVLYDEIMEILKGKKITCLYVEATADNILLDIMTAAGLPLGVGSCPTDPVTVQFDDALCSDAAMWLAASLGKDWWTYNMKFYVGTRGSAKSLSSFTTSTRGVDRSKKRDMVIVKGVDVDGNAITGTAGSGSKVAVYRERNESDQATLDGLAAKYLAELNTESSGAPISTTINYGANLFAGDTVPLTKASLALSGTYRIMSVEKQKTKVNFQVDRMRESIDKIIADLKKYKELGITIPGQDPLGLNLQSLIGHYHLVEGTGTVAKNTAPDSTTDGTITNPNWIQPSGQASKLLYFNATTFVNLGSMTVPANLDTFAIGCWFSPDTSTDSYLISGPAFNIQYVGSTGQLSFWLKIGGMWSGCVTGINEVNQQRWFVMCVYDGAQMKIYLNGLRLKAQDQTGYLDEETGSFYIGCDTAEANKFSGYIAECMFWNRALIGQEVNELYFFPLTRIMKKVVGGGTSWFVDIIVSPSTGGSCSPNSLQTVDAGETLEVILTLTDAILDRWELDGVDVGNANPYTIPAQTAGTAHTLEAFTQPSSQVAVYDQTHADDYVHMTHQHPSNDTLPVSAASQSFQVPAGADMYLAKMRFYIMRIGTVTGTLTAKLYAHSGSFGTTSVPGTALATCTTPVAVESIGASYQWVEFTFDGTYLMTAGAYYCAGFELTTFSTHDDIGNCIKLARDLSLPIHPGNHACYRNGNWDTEYPTLPRDTIFEVLASAGIVGDTYAVSMSATDGGSTSPTSPQLVTKSVDDSFQVTAIPNDFYELDYFLLDGFCGSGQFRLAWIDGILFQPQAGEIGFPVGSARRWARGGGRLILGESGKEVAAVAQRVEGDTFG